MGVEDKTDMSADYDKFDDGNPNALYTANHRVVVRRQIGLRSRQRQDVFDDLQPSEQVLGMLLIIKDPCRCLDPTEGRVHLQPPL